MRLHCVSPNLDHIPIITRLLFFDIITCCLDRFLARREVRPIFESVTGVPSEFNAIANQAGAREIVHVVECTAFATWNQVIPSYPLIKVVGCSGSKKAIPQ